MEEIIELLQSTLNRKTMSNERYLFRGKRIDENRFIYGSLSVEYDGSCFISYWVPLLIDAEANSYEPHQLNYQVIPETLGQYTGLKDKNGTKIFEGDRFKTLNGFIGRIEWGHKVYLDKKNRYEFHGWLYVNDSNNHSETLDSEILAGEVIGSIHDNDKAVNP